MEQSSQKRSIKKIRHREMLITATSDLIAQDGIANTSITKIIENAGLSRGMVHLHFSNKQELMVEVAREVSRQYFQNMQVFLDRAGSTPSQRLEAIITADLSEVILNRRSVNIWYAFRGEARSHNEFMEHCDTRDNALRQMIFDAYMALAEQSEEPDTLARDAMHGTIALLEGMWTDYFLHSDQFNRNTAKRIILRFVSALFPNAFAQDQPKS